MRHQAEPGDEYNNKISQDSRHYFTESIRMTVLEFTLLVWLGALAAGLLGSLTGLGGGVVIVPLLALGLGVDLRYAIGASLVSVIATSSGAAAAFVKEGYTNIRLGMFLEIATTLGRWRALSGGDGVRLSHRRGIRRRLVRVGLFIRQAASGAGGG